MTDTSTAINFGDTSSLSAVLADCWRSLAAAVTDRDCGWRLPVLATGNAETFRQRIVVLRDVDIQHRLLFAHTDLRSPKIASIRANPWTSWLFYDQASMSQLQITGKVSIHDNDGIADRIWASEVESSLRGYLAPFPPGTVSAGPESNLPASVAGRIPDRNELQSARPNFAVIACHVESIEWLQLNRDGNLRARFVYTSNDVQSEWLAS